MHTNHYIILAILALFFNCNKQSRIDTVDKRLNTVLAIQKRALKQPDSFFLDLKKAEKLIALGGISDSIKGENNFMIGRRYARRYSERYDLDSAAFYFHRATEYVKAPITDSRYVNYFYFTWNIYSRLGKYGDCFSISDRFKTLLEKDENYIWHATAYFMEDNIHKLTNNHKEALASSELRIDMLEKAGDTISIRSALMSKAESLYYTGRKKEAFSILDQLISKEQVLDNDDNRKLFSDYALYLAKEKDLGKSLRYQLKSMRYKKKMASSDMRKRLIASGYSNIADVYIQLKDYNNARKYLDSVRQLDIRTVSRDLQKEVLLNELKIDILDGQNFDKGFEDLNAIFDFQDSSYEEKYSNELVALKKANENEQIILKEKQEAEIKSLKLQTDRKLLIISMALLGIIGYLFYRQRKVGFQKQQLQMQQRLLRSQMNPHFTSNILYSIQNLVKKSPEEASNYLVKFSRLLRLVLENSMSNYVQLEDELETLKKYIDLQLLRYGPKFSYEFVLNVLEEDDLIFIPPMLIQPIVENSIEHGLLNLEDSGNLRIVLSRKDKFIECVVEDNGQGLQKNQNSRKHSASTKLINDFLRKTTKSGLKVQNKNDIDQDQSGVLVTFLIPYKLTEDD